MRPFRVFGARGCGRPWPRYGLVFARPARSRQVSARTYTSYMATRPRNIRLRAESYELLEQEAKRRGMEPDALADELLRAELAGAANGDLDMALARLAEFRSQLPDIDGVALASEARRELEERDA